MSYNLKSIKQEFKKKGIFYTTSDLAVMMKNLIDIPVSEVYDPTCGDGMLLSVFGDDVAKYGQEINQHQLDVAAMRLGNFTGVCGDTLKSPAFSEKKFAVIMANPPFSVRWEPPQSGLFGDERFRDAPAMPPASKADYAFLLHIMHYLADDGIALVLNFPGILYRGNAEGKIRAWMVEQNWIEKVIHIPAKTFVDTTIATALLVLRKDKKTTDVVFVDSEKGLERVVPVVEIQANGYTLSVNTYVQEPKEEEEAIDEHQMIQDVRQMTLNNLRRSIEMEKMMCSFSGSSITPFLDDLKATVESFYPSSF